MNIIKSLLKNYPFIKFSEDEDYSLTWMDYMPHGWRIAFGKEFLEDLKNAIKENDFEYGYKILELKEKWGKLRLYDNTDFTDELLDKYEDLSSKVCQICGKPAEVITKGWIGYFCKDCADRVLDQSYEELEVLNDKE